MIYNGRLTSDEDTPIEVLSEELEVDELEDDEEDVEAFLDRFFLLFLLFFDFGFSFSLRSRFFSFSFNSSSAFS